MSAPDFLSSDDGGLVSVGAITRIALEGSSFTTERAVMAYLTDGSAICLLRGSGATVRDHMDTLRRSLAGTDTNPYL